MKRFHTARIIGAALVLLALAACSAIKLGYNNLDQAAFWWLDGYLDFDEGRQSQQVRADLERLHAWHRASELPRVVSLLQRAQQLAPGDITPEQACAFVPELRERMQAIAVQAEPALAQRVVGFGPAQLEQLQRKYEENNREFHSEWVRPSPAERLALRAERFTERAERIYGTLSPAQVGALQEQLARSSFDPARVLAERQRRQQDTLQTLRKLAGQGATPEQARTELRALAARMFTSPDAAYRSYQETLTQETCRTLAAVHNAAGPQQRAEAVRRLQGYQRDLQELVAGA